MVEQADEERLAELNRNKEAYEARERTAEREYSARQDVEETARRNQLADQRRQEEKQQRAEVEASASRIAEGRRKYREEKEVEESAAPIAAGRQKYREEQAEKSRQALNDANRERDVRRGHDNAGKNIQYGDLNYKEQRIVQDEVEQSSSILKSRWAKQKAAREVQEKDTYYKNTSTKQQAMDALSGKKTPWKKDYTKEQLLDMFEGKPPRPSTGQVKPITTFLGGQKHKVGERLEAAKKNFIAETMAPLKGAQQARERRREKQTGENALDPFRGLTQSQQQARTRRHRPREGTGMLFSEGFFNPPARANPPKKGKKGAKPRAPRSILDFDLDRIL